jgi:protocatechuate 3,4-dioxygenase beta subunit
MMHEPDHDDRHDRGILHDLTVLRERRLLLPRRFERRGALKLLGGAGMGLLLVACGSDPKSSSDTTASTTSTTGATTTTAASSGGNGSLVTDAVPEETGGPFPGDGSNGPNVLTESGVVRRDIRSSFGEYSGTAGGVDVGVDLTIVNAGDGSPFPGAAIYIWHCTAEGGYSLYSQGVEQENFLRGVQEADADGKVLFTSIYPGAYDGRWPHIHVEVFSSLADATRASGKLVTSQIALLGDTSRSVYGSNDLYRASAGNVKTTSLESDMVFQDGASLQQPTMSGDIGSNLRMALTIAV